MEAQDHQLNLLKLKRLITSGVQSIPQDKKHKSAIMVIGDTGVGKTTILSFLAKRKLFIKVHGLNTILDSDDNDGLKIGHDRFSETRVPSKIIIDRMVFFDCSGFKDNRGEEFEISNSFFVQRLFNIYHDIKILLIVDQSSISESRADKLPKLIRNLLNSFDSLKDIQDGVILLINKAKPQFNDTVYAEQILKMAKLKGQDGYLFKTEQRQFLQFLVKNKRISLFKQAQKQDEGKLLDVKEQNLLRLIKDANYVKSKKIKNIISESAKLSIREYIDRIAIDAEEKIQKFVRDLIKEITYQSRADKGNGVQGNMEIKKRALAFDSLVQNTNIQNLSTVLSENTNTQMGSLQQGICTVIFFKNIYDKAQLYVKLLKSTISSQISKLLVNVDEQINRLQEQQKKLNELQNKLSAQVQKANSFEEKLGEKQKTIEELLKKIQSLEGKHQQENNSMLENIASKQKTILQLTNQVSNMKSLLESLKQESDNKAGLYEKLTEENNQTKQMNQGYKNHLQAHKIKINELLAIQGSMQQQIQAHLEDIQLLNIQNASLKKELDIMAEDVLKKQELKSKVSTTSKTSKYPEVECPHFKNGGKCVHCIKKWKAEQKEKRKKEKEQEI